MAMSYRAINQSSLSLCQYKMDACFMLTTIQTVLRQRGSTGLSRHGAEGVSSGSLHPTEHEYPSSCLVRLTPECFSGHSGTAL